jgi:hypothetical protein
VTYFYGNILPIRGYTFYYYPFIQILEVKDVPQLKSQHRIQTKEGNKLSARGHHSSGIVLESKW